MELSGCIESGQNLVVYGRRRVGKSSLVQRVGMQFPERLLFQIDLFFTKDAAMFLEYCSNALFSFNHQRKGFLERGVSALRRIQPQIELDPNSGTPSFSFRFSQKNQGVLLNTVDDFFDFLGKEFTQDQIIIGFDEFQSVLNYPAADSFLAKIRGKIQYHSFPYIFTGSDRNGLKTIFTQPSSPFYKSIRPLEVEAIPKEDFKPFLEEKFASGDRQVLPDVWDGIFSLEVPGDIQQLCAALWESSSQNSTLGAEILAEARQRVFSQELEGFRSLLSGLTALQLRVLKFVARNGTDSLYSHETQQTIGASGSSIRRSLTALADKWILVKDENKMYFNNPFLRQFLMAGLTIGKESGG